MTNANSISFTGYISGKYFYEVAGKEVSRETRPVCCCPHGDMKFIRSVNHIFGKGLQDTLEISLKKDGIRSKLNVEMDRKLFQKCVKISPFERAFMRVLPFQDKFLKNKNISRIVYSIDETEFKHLREEFFSNKISLRHFRKNIAKVLDKNKLKSFF